MQYLQKTNPKVRAMRTHLLKIKDTFMAAIFSGDKTFEVRFNDRDFQKGDHIQFLDEAGNRQIIEYYEITYIHSGLGMLENYVVLGIRKLDEN